MQPLARQESRLSFLSWWSDSNPPGPTINLHAAAKPLARFLYHRQALQIIRKNRDSPLSTTTLEIYRGYFPWNFVSSLTKAAILRELAKRVGSSEAEARMVVESPLFPCVTQMLWSPDTHWQAQSSSYNLLGKLAQHESTAPAVLELKLCPQLVSLLHDRDSRVIWRATYTLAQIALWPDGAHAVIEANAIDHILELLGSPSPDIQGLTCMLVRNLAAHKSTAPAILKLKLCPQLVSLLHNQDSSVISHATSALSRIALCPDGARGIIKANNIDHILELLESPNPEVQRLNCMLVGNLAAHESTAPAILKLKLCPQLVSLLRNQDSSVISNATYALSQIARRLDSANDVIEANVIDHILELLGSPSPDIQRLSCKLVGNLAAHESIAPIILELKPCPRLVSFLHDRDSSVISNATYALSHISRWLDGAHDVIETNVIDHILELLKLPNSEIQRWIYVLVGNLAAHKSTAPTILELKLCPQLVSLLCDQDSEVTWRATYTLSQIALWPDGAQAQMFEDQLAC
ncbi:hypothetical protein MVEN_00898200 [Mycena venus]|uniref:ARM repeat-containing protein n=1 Tax=Mycena venus TaxID=2733690 RepID=A0A8H6YH51_9AGAR|nr:hypothetical protein MVEN_00898200 [Mycena venus]